MMWRFSLYCKVLLSIWASLVRCELTGLSWHAQENLLAEAALILANDEGEMKGCKLEPEFHTSNQFYTLNCVRAVAAVDIYPKGDFIYSDGNIIDSKDPLHVVFDVPRKAYPFYLHACPKKMSENDKIDATTCTQYHVDAFRIGDDASELATIALTAEGLPVMVTPSFDPRVKHYTANVEIDLPVIISAAHAEGAGGVGIEWIGSDDSGGGIERGKQGCKDHGMLARSRSFRIAPLKAAGYYKYKVCAVAANLMDITYYYLTVKTTLHYTAKLSSIDIGQYTSKLTPPFDGDIQDYFVTVPITEKIVGIKVKSLDVEAGLSFKINEVEQDVKVDGEMPRGKAGLDVAMPNNDDLQDGETPQWTRTVSVKVKSADDSFERHYIITIKEEVSNFCDLKNITPSEETHCIGGLKPAFRPDIFEYECTWWWENKTTHKEMKIGAVRATMDEERCRDCQLLVPDFRLNEHEQLSWNPEGDRREFMSGELWHRKFLYGEHHRIPFQVVSANKFTSHTYYVTLKRDAPWWMQTWLTRLVSHSATILSVLMAASSITNVMALAKQVQFMSLTCEIKGVPPVYEDFAQSLKTFNFDAFDYIPFDKLGIPTKKDFLRMKHAWIETMKKKLGIEHATLLLQYCYARDMTKDTGLLYPNAILERDPQHAAELIMNLEAFEKNEAMKAKAAITDARLLGTSDTHMKDEEEDKKVRRMITDLFLSPRSADEDDVFQDDLHIKQKRLAGTSSLRGSSFSNVSWAWNSTRKLTDVVLSDYDEDFEDYSDIDLDAVSLEEDFDELEVVLRRLEEDEKMSKEEKEKKLMTEFGKKLNWFRQDYKKLLKLILKRPEWRDLDEKEAKEKLTKKYALLSCVNKEISIVEDGLLLLHQLFAIRKLLRTTTGTFIILCFMIGGVGSIYAFIYYTCLHGKQKRPRILEPGPLLIFCLDYPLIAFAKSAAKVAFHPQPVQLFTYNPPHNQVAAFCLCGLVCYPIAFLVTIGWKIHALINRNRVIWNQSFEKYTDPRCANVKIIMPPDWVSGFIPVLPDLLTTQVRAAIPVLDKEGNELTFFGTQEETKKETDIKALGDQGALYSKYKHELEGEISKLGQEVQVEEDKNKQEKRMANNDLKTKMHKLDELKKQKIFMATLEQSEEEHKSMLTKAKTVDMDTRSNNGDFVPPWFNLKKKAQSEEQEAEEDTLVIKPLATYTDEMVSKKQRNEIETLDAEERFAMIQWIDQQIRDERKYQKYCIFRVVAHRGCLCPKEPIRGNHFFEEIRIAESRDDLKKQQAKEKTLATAQTSDLHSDDLWLATKEDYEEPSEPWGGHLEWRGEAQGERFNEEEFKNTPEHQEYLTAQRKWRGHNADLVEFAMESTNLHHDVPAEEMEFIENEIGQRLVFLGTDGWIQSNGGYSFWKDKFFIPGGSYGGICVWQEEPNEGWDDWFKTEREKKPTMCYADKWQWLYLNEPEPWNEDDLDESDINVCGILTVKKSEVFFWNEYSKSLHAKYGSRVPFRVVGSEKVEMRKWLWDMLLKRALLKLKIAWMADKNAKYYQTRSQVEIMQTPFKEIWHQVNTGEPNEKYKSILKDRAAANADELLDYTLMKIEDTFGFDEEEEWMTEVDKTKTGEVKVQFDTQHFWLNEKDPDLHDLREQNSLVPRAGYWHSAFFLKDPEREVGVKRYTFFKPDKSRAKVVVNVRMKHVLPLMKYTSGFKCNVSEDTLDMPFRDNYVLVLGNAKKNEENNYVIERISTLVSIIVLAKNPGGLFCALVFTSTKSVAWLNALCLGWSGLSEEELGGDDDKIKKLKGTCKASFKRFIVAFLDADTLTQFLQVLTLSMLAMGQVGFPPPLCAIICIFICSSNMILMNVKTFGRQFEEGMEDLQEKWASLQEAYAKQKLKFMLWLNGDNAFGYQFVAIDGLTDNTERLAESITVVVAELGLAFDGEPDMDPGMAPEEIRSRSLYKKIVPYNFDLEDPEDHRKKSAKDHDRYIADIEKSLYVSIDTDQMMMRKNLPQIIATIQCINHSEHENVCKAQFDSYLTLFKQLPGGDDWEDDWDNDEEKLTALTDFWELQVSDWLTHQLGAIEVEGKTATKAIREDITNLLKNEGSKTGALTRDMYKFRIPNTYIPVRKASRTCTNLEGKLGYVRVLYDTETITSAFPRNRITPFGKFVKQVKPKNEEDKDEEATKSTSWSFFSKGNDEIFVLELSNPEFDVELRLGVSDVRFVVMVQDTEKRKGHEVHYEEVVAFSDTIDLSQLQHTDQEKLLKTLYTQWSKQGQVLDPYGGIMYDTPQQIARKQREKEQKEKQEAGRSKFTKVKEAVKGCFQKCWAKCISCSCFSNEVGEEEARKYHGKIMVSAHKFSKEQSEDDKIIVEAVEDITQGASAMNLEKIKRHKDRWLSLAGFFGLKTLSTDLEDLEKFIDTLKNAKATIREKVDQYLASPENAESREGVKKLRDEIDEIDFQIARVAEPYYAMMATMAENPRISLKEKQMVEDLNYDGVAARRRMSTRHSVRLSQTSVPVLAKSESELQSTPSQPKTGMQTQGSMQSLRQGSAGNLSDGGEDMEKTRSKNLNRSASQLSESSSAGASSRRSKSRSRHRRHDANWALKQAHLRLKDLQKQKREKKVELGHFLSKPTRAILKAQGMRRTLEDEELMDEAIERLSAQIEKRKGHLKKLDAEGIHPKRIHELHEIKLSGQIVKRLQGVDWWDCCSKKDDSQDEQNQDGGSDFAFNLLGQLRKYQMERLASGKQVLHYVIISDQLKPSKIWKPDAIMPHVAQITAREFEDLEGDAKEVKLIFGERKKDDKNNVYKPIAPDYKDGIVFLKEELSDKKQPMLQAGRICFKSREQALIDSNSGQVKFCKDGDTTMYLYWDGNRRWVISPFKGETPPYGFTIDEARGFCWAQDPAPTPDKITRPFHVYVPVPPDDDEASPWQPDHALKVHGPARGGKKHGKLGRFKGKLTLGKANDGSGGIFSLGEELKNLVLGGDGLQTDPEKRDCLVSLTSEYVHFAWKDDNIERLAPFRKFILKEFGNYNRAWFHMTRQKTFSKKKGIDNLKMMLKESYDSLVREIEAMQQEEFNAKKAEEHGRSSTGSMPESDQIMGGTNTEGSIHSDEGGTASRMSRISKTSSASSGGGDDPARVESAVLSNEGEQQKVDSRIDSRASGGEMMAKRNSVQGNKRMSTYHSLARRPTDATQGAQRVTNIGTTFKSADEIDEEETGMVDTWALKRLKEFIDKYMGGDGEGEAGGMGEFEELARQVMDAMDRDNVETDASNDGPDGRISVGEVIDMYESRPILVGNLANAVTQDQLMRWFSDALTEVGEVASLTLCDNEPNRTGKKYAFVHFKNSSVGQAALDHIQALSEGYEADFHFDPTKSDPYTPKVRYKRKADLDFLKKLLENFKTIQHGLPLEWENCTIDQLSENIHPYMVWMEDEPEEGDREPLILEEFSVWLLRHPWYREVHSFWGELSDGLEINRQEFTHAMSSSLLKFMDKGAGAAPAVTTSSSILGTSMLDVKNQVALRSAEWQNPKKKAGEEEEGDEDQDDTSRLRKRTLHCKFRAVGKQAIGLFQNVTSWTIGAEGVHGGIKPSHRYDHEQKTWVDLTKAKNLDVKTEDDEALLTLSYDEVPVKALYFTYGSGNTAYTGKHWTQVAFRGTFPGAPEEKAKQIFADLDSQMSNGISRKELIPSSGESREAAGQSMLKFSVPLNHIQEVLPSTNFADSDSRSTQKMKLIKIKCNRENAKDEPWSNLKLALNPEWKAADDEEMNVFMLPEYWELWKTVIDDTDMDRPQENVRYYIGGYLEHTLMKGVYMRHGTGTQRWPNGQVYSGGWENHVYHGEGQLWWNFVDYEAHKQQRETANQGIPIYTGNWNMGNRHGIGCLNWEQDQYDVSEKRSAFSRTHHSGIKKCYYGEFAEGLFYGRGTLILKGAVSQALPTNTNDRKWDLKRVPPPQMHPTKLLRFEGNFESDWQEVYKEFIEKDYDPQWIRNHGHNEEALREDGYEIKIKDQGDFDLLPRDGADDEEEFIFASNLQMDKLFLLDGDDKADSGKFQRYFAKDRKDGAQKAGEPVPDLGLAFYSLKVDGVPNDCRHIKNGTATYADGTRYVGYFKNGLPHGQGDMQQYEGDGSRKPVATYSGQWKKGKKSGKGVYNIDGNLTYDGQWGADEFVDKRHGKGVQRIDEAFQALFGYSEYDGEWSADKRHGVGTMLIPKQGEVRYTYEGQFEDGARSGSGKMLTGEGKLIYHGLWKSDYLDALDEDKPAWSQMDKNVYYGTMSREGDREGKGILYDAKAMQDEAFVECIQNNKPFEGDMPNKHKLYEGQFRKNLPNGEGVQYCFKKDDGKHEERRLGEYKGTFVDGRRHGRGIWDGVDTNGKPWKYRPIPGTAHNWSKDMMHGIAIVEDAKHVHENVIYTNNVSQMPWTKEGPPMTGFDSNSALGKLFSGKLPMMHGAGDRHTGEAGLHEHTQLLKPGIKSKKDDFSDQLAAEEAEACPILVRQPTDLNMPEEDVKIDGGTDENKDLNGLYYKMSGTFGYPIYKCAKLISGGLDRDKKPKAMYLYQDQKKELWLISDTPAHDTGEKIMSLGRACAMVEDDSPDPGSVVKPWFVWHEDTQRMREHTENEQDPELYEKKKGWFKSKELRKIDKLTIQSVVGFEVTGVNQNGFGGIQSLFLRHPSLFYGRPVYESENGGQFLYWRKDKGEIEEGLQTAMLDSPGDLVDLKNEIDGHWIISTDLGFAKKADSDEWHESVFAYIKDGCFSPDQIHPVRPEKGKKEATWWARDRSAGNQFKECRLMKLKLEEWSHEAQTDLKILDGATGAIEAPAALAIEDKS